VRRQSEAVTALLDVVVIYELQVISKAVSRCACHRTPKPGGEMSPVGFRLSPALPLPNLSAL
jgi:hypothetical protein